MSDRTSARHTITASANIPARRERVYALIANYRDGRPRILPRQFKNLVVEQGGIGAGTMIRFQMSIFGKTETFRAAITEPDPGHILVETNLDSNGAVTTFTVGPGPAPADSHVTISTELPVRNSVLGYIEKALTTALLRPIYKKELENLARVATGPFGS
ncbi:MAG: SRPBCC family protein [Bryobacteraceae bacterium]